MQNEDYLLSADCLLCKTAQNTKCDKSGTCDSAYIYFKTQYNYIVSTNNVVLRRVRATTAAVEKQ